MVARDGERTKESILSAAEDLFARHGFDGTSMQQIGEAAGVARSTPAYFFRSKEALYEAVLARAVARAETVLAARRHDGQRAPEEAVASYVDALVDLLSRDRNLVSLIQRESLGDGSRVAPFLGRLADEAVEVFTPVAEQAGVPPQRLVLDVVALSWYPLAHENTLLPALGMTPRDPAFLEEHKRHLTGLLQSMTGGREPSSGDEPAETDVGGAGGPDPDAT